MTDQGIALSDVPDLDVSVGLQDTGGGNWVTDTNIFLGAIYIIVMIMP